MDRKALKELWENPLLNPMGAIVRDIDPQGKASPTIPETYGEEASSIGSVPGSIIGQNAGIMAVRPLTNMLPPTVPGTIAKGALNLGAAYLGGGVGGGVGGGIAGAVGHNIEKEKNPLPPIVNKALSAHATEEPSSTMEAFKKGFKKGFEASTGPEQLIGIPFIGGGKGYNKSYKGSAKELIGFQGSRRLTPQSPFEFALEKTMKIFPHIIPKYNPDQMISEGKGVGKESTPDITMRDIQENYYDETGKYIPQGLIEPQNSSVGSLGAGVTPLLGSKELRKKTGEVLGEIGGKLSNIDNPKSLLNEVEGLKDNAYSPRDKRRINDSLMSQRYANVMEDVKGEVYDNYHRIRDELKNLSVDPTTGKDIYVTLPETRNYLHGMVEPNSGNPQFKEVWDTLQQEAARKNIETTDPQVARQNALLAAPARAILYGEPIRLSQLSSVRPFLTDIANTTPGANKGGVQSVVEALDSEIRTDPQKQFPPGYGQKWDQWVSYYKDKIADLFTEPTLTRQALDQSQRYHNPNRATEAKLKFADITEENPNLLHILDESSERLFTELSPDTYNQLKSLVSEFRQYRLNKGYNAAKKSTVLGAESLRDLVDGWEKKSKDEAFALLKGKTTEETIQNVQNMDLWMGTLKQVSNSGPVNHQAFLHLGQILQGAGAVAALSQAIQKRGVGIWGSLMYYTTAFAFPYVTAHVLANPKFMGYAIDGLRTGVLPRGVLQSYLQWGEDSGALDILKDKYDKYKDWANKKNIPYGEKVEEFFKEDEKISPMRSDTTYSPSLESKKLDPSQVDSYLESFK